MPAPSPVTKPSRPLSKGRLAFSGASLRSDSARAAQKPPMPSGVMVASVPPANITSACRARWYIIASPMEWLPVAQAETGEKLGPLQPVLQRQLAGPRLMMSAGMKNGLIRFDALLEVDPVRLLDGGEAAHAGADDGADAVAVLLLQVEAGVLHGHVGRPPARTG